MTVLITGASNGIGNAVCRYLVANKINCIALDICDISIENVKFYKCDVTNINQLDEIANKLEEENIELDAVINIAGIFMIDSFIEGNIDEINRIFNVNLFGTINVNKCFYKLLKPNGKIIITTSEVAPLDPLPFNGIYNVTKTALDAYAQALRQELNLLGIKVITVRPGAFSTNLSNSSLDKTKELMNKTVMYHKQSKKFYTLVKKFMGKPSHVDKISKVYYKALTKKHPKLIYKKHINQLLKLLSILPIRLQCFIIKLLLK